MKMKAIKIFTGVFVMISLMVLSSCSDSITSFLNSAHEENQSSASDFKRKGDYYSSKYTINPGDYVYLHAGITGLNSISQYSVSNCGITKKDFYISASNIDAQHSLPCGSKEYVLDDLLIENTSGEIKTVEVTLYSNNEFMLSPLSSGNQVSETVDSKSKEFQTSFKIEPGEKIRFDNQNLPMQNFSGIKLRNLTIHESDICDKFSYFLRTIPGPSGIYEVCLKYDEEIKESSGNFYVLDITNLSDYVLSLEVVISR